MHWHILFSGASQTDRVCFFSILCSLYSPAVSFFFLFRGRWWHDIKVISICYTAHLGQLEETCFVLSVFVTPCPIDLQLVAWLWRPQVFNKCLSYGVLKGCVVATRQLWHELKRALLFWRLHPCTCGCACIQAVVQLLQKYFTILIADLVSYCLIWWYFVWILRKYTFGFQWKISVFMNFFRHS